MDLHRSSQLVSNAPALSSQTQQQLLHSQSQQPHCSTTAHSITTTVDLKTETNMHTKPLTLPFRNRPFGRLRALTLHKLIRKIDPTLRPNFLTCYSCSHMPANSALKHNYCATVLIRPQQPKCQHSTAVHTLSQQTALSNTPTAPRCSSYHNDRTLNTATAVRTLQLQTALSNTAELST